MTLRTPKYRLHKPSGQAVVTISGKDLYLGKYNSPESRSEYDRQVSEWLASGRQASRAGVGPDLTVNELALGFIRHADGYYRKNGKHTSEYGNIKLAVRELTSLYGDTLARDFGPLALKAVRERLIEDGICRTQINKRISRITLGFRWAAENELLPVTIYQALKTVAGLRRGRSNAIESEPVRPVPDTFVDSIKPYVSRQVWAMIELQRLTGARPGEVVTMRTMDLDTSGKVWVYRPESHKTEHHGMTKEIYLGPKAQAIIRPWLKTDLQAPLFSPAEAIEEWQARKRILRKTKVQPSQRSRAKANPELKPKDRYSGDSYRTAIKRGCDKAGVPHWHPHRLRHSCASWLRKEFGLDVARVVLGHRSPAVTEIYAEVDRGKAIEVMALVG